MNKFCMILLVFTFITGASQASEVYPKATSGPAIEKLDKSAVAAAIITQREAGKSQAEAIGLVLNGSDDVKTFYEVWEEIEQERKSLKEINPVNYENESDYEAALAAKKKYLSEKTWNTKLKESKGASDFNDLKSKYEGN